MIDYVLEIP